MDAPLDDNPKLDLSFKFPDMHTKKRTFIYSIYTLHNTFLAFMQNFKLINY